MIDHWHHKWQRFKNNTNTNTNIDRQCLLDICLAQEKLLTPFLAVKQQTTFLDRFSLSSAKLRILYQSFIHFSSQEQENTFHQIHENNCRKTCPWEAGGRLPPWLWHLPCFPCYGTAPLYGLKVRPAQHNHHNQSHYQHGRPYYFGQILLIINLSSTTVKRAAVVVEGFFPFLIGKPFFMDFWAERSSVFCRVEMLKHVLRIPPSRILHFFHLS